MNTMKMLAFDVETLEVRKIDEGIVPVYNRWENYFNWPEITRRSRVFLVLQ